ncbi:MAG TPA: CAP domain-containing protein [Sphingobium sp.]
MTGGFLKRIVRPWPLIFLILAIPASAQTERQRNIRDRLYDPNKPQARGDALLRYHMLAAHNRARAAVDVPPLVWNAGLAAEAEAYARALARSRSFRHSDKAQRSKPQGENLWMGSSGGFTYAEMAASWVDERRYYRPRSVLPNISTTGDWHDVGHYTQVIWRATTAVGCGLASNDDDDYLVCRYTPPGNVYGQSATAEGVAPK